MDDNTKTTGVLFAELQSKIQDCITFHSISFHFISFHFIMIQILFRHPNTICIIPSETPIYPPLSEHRTRGAI